MNEELKPCPFCGGSDLIFAGNHLPFIECLDCNAYGPSAPKGRLVNADEAAAHAWNTRASVKVKPLVWKKWYFGDAFAKTAFGIYNTREGEWREPKARTRWHKADDPRAAAQADYERRILEMLE